MDQNVVSHSKIAARPWKENTLPGRILIIRLQAMGDVVATLPYLQQLRNSLLSTTRIDFLTRQEVEDIPNSIVLFDNVFVIKGGRDLKKQIVYASSMLPKLFRQRYDVIIDLQNNNLSRLVRKALLPKAWSAFDRFSPIAGGERYRMTIEAAGFSAPFARPFFKEFTLKAPEGIQALNDRLRAAGILGGLDLGTLMPQMAGHALLCVTEKRTREEIDRLVTVAAGGV
jgi:hypothetical protein